LGLGLFAFYLDFWSAVLVGFSPVALIAFSTVVKALMMFEVSTSPKQPDFIAMFAASWRILIAVAFSIV
jgi:hypothetical protein